MRKLALIALAATAFLTFSAVSPRPPVLELTEGPLPKCGANGDVCLGTSSTQVQTGGNLLVNKPILVGPSSTTSTIVIDAGVTIVGNEVLTGTLKTAGVDAGYIVVGGGQAVYRVLAFTTASINFASGTIVCEDSAGTTVTGAKTTDTCTVGMPSTLTGAGTGLHHSYTCYVSAADTVKIRACAAGTADDPGAVTFTGYVLGAVP